MLVRLLEKESRRGWLVALTITLALACRTSSELTPPPQETRGEVGPALSEGGGGGGDPAEAGELEGGDEGAEGPGDEQASGGGEPASGPVEATPGEAPAAAQPLPAPLFTKKIEASCGQDPGVGEAARPFVLKTPEGQELSLASLRGKVVLLNFWGTWCKPCLEELPEFDRLYRRYRKHGLVVVAVATDVDPAPVQDFARLRKLATKLLIGGEAHANAYKSPNFPFTFVIDPKGVIRGSYRGYKPECMSKLEADLRGELEKQRSKR